MHSFHDEVAAAPADGAAPDSGCALCGRAICEHPDPIYAGIVPVALDTDEALLARVSGDALAA
ncbi:MAG: hypothetical protein ACTHJR_01560 [Sphingomonas sp.]|uniref:hypothetical protein n=1 Tax=Sphingomonas sp. TaxID=28214 RepID=UPI003F80E4D3